MLIKFLIFSFLFKLCSSYKILLVFALPSKSHGILSEGFARHLLEAGHEVTHVSPFPIKNPPKNLRNVDISENKQFINMDVFDVHAFVEKEIDLQDQTLLISAMDELWKGTAQLEAMQRLMNDPNEQFDVVVAEWIYSELISGMATVFNCPLVWVSTMDPHTLVLSLMDEHLNPAYTVHHTSKDFSFTFLDRVYQLWSLSRVMYYKWANADKEREAYREIYNAIVAKKGRELPDYDDVKYNASLMLGNTDVTAGDGIALPQSYKHIGGYYIKDTTESLPKYLKEVIDNATDGFIYFSLGSNVKSSSIPDRTKRDLLNTFSGLKETVVWKFEEPLQDLPKNVHMITWAPQQSILAHPRCLLFITHGGLLSTLETLHAGIPIIGIPFFADQYPNVNRAVAKGFGKRIDFDENLAGNLKSMINEILGNSSYRQRAKELSAAFKHRPLPPGKELVHWIEHVIITKGAPHLRSAARRVSWYQKLYLDLLLVVVLALISLLVICKYTLSVYLRKIVSSKSKIL